MEEIKTCLEDLETEKVGNTEYRILSVVYHREAKYAGK